MHSGKLKFSSTFCSLSIQSSVLQSRGLWIAPISTDAHRLDRSASCSLANDNREVSSAGGCLIPSHQDSPHLFHCKWQDFPRGLCLATLSPCAPFSLRKHFIINTMFHFCTSEVYISYLKYVYPSDLSNGFKPAYLMCSAPMLKTNSIVLLQHWIKSQKNLCHP